MTRAALYVRISQDQTGQHLGVTRQLEDCTEHARALGWDITETYTDNDISAASGKQRPGYRAMLTAIDAGHIEAIIAWHPDRLYRVVKDLGELVDVCKRNQTQISTVRAGTIDLNTPTGRLIAGLLAQVATYEGEAKSDRWKRSWRQGREAGRWVNTGTRLFGYTRQGEIVPAEAAVAQQMADRILRGDTIQSVARWLAVEGIQGTRNTDWTHTAVKQYLLRPTLAGWSTISREEPTGKLDEHNNPITRRVWDIVGPGDWEPIIDPAQWEEIRAFLTARRRTVSPRVATLNGLIHCGKCGHRLITSSQRRVRNYRCPNRPNMPGCGTVSGNAQPIETIVETYAQERLADQRLRDRIAALRAQPTGTQAEVAALELRITELEQQLDEPGTPVATILRAVDRAKARQDELLRELAARNLTPIPAADDWPTDIKRRRALIDLVVDRVELLPADYSVSRRLGFNPERVRITGR